MQVEKRSTKDERNENQLQEFFHSHETSWKLDRLALLKSRWAVPKSFGSGRRCPVAIFSSPSTSSESVELLGPVEG